MALHELLDFLAADTSGQKRPSQQPRPPYTKRDGSVIVTKQTWYDAKQTGTCGELAGHALLNAAHELDPAICGVFTSNGKNYYHREFAETARRTVQEAEARTEALQALLWKLLHAGRAL